MDTKITHVALGMEEMALSLSLVGKADIGKEIINGIYPNVSAERMDGLLTSASHSLLARGLAEVENGQARVTAEMAHILDPFVNYQFLVTLSLGVGKEQINALIRCQENGSFTSHFVRSGLVHVLENGTQDELVQFLFSPLQSFILPNPADPVSLPINMSSIGKALEATAKKEAVMDLFASSGWEEKYIRELGADFEQSTARASIVRADINSQMDASIKTSVKTASILLVCSQARSWIMVFADGSETATGVLQRTTGEGLLAAIKKMIAAPAV